MDGEGRNRTAAEAGGRGGGGGPACATDGEGGKRTADTTIFSRVLYQLSYLAGRLRLVGTRGALHRPQREPVEAARAISTAAAGSATCSMPGPPSISPLPVTVQLRRVAT